MNATDTLYPTEATAVPPGGARLGEQAEQQLRTVTEVQAAVLSHPQLKDAGAALVREVATRMGFDRVALGVCRGPKVQVVATSDGLPPARHTPLMAQLAAAMAEALDQHCSIAVPPVREGAHPRITLALQQLMGTDAGCAVSVPVVVAAGAQAQVSGVLCAQRFGAGRVSAQELALLEQLALLAAPVLRLMSLNERRWYQRAWDATSAANDALHDGSRKTLRYGSAAAALALAAALLVPADTRVGGTARLEGAVQRVLVAPADGFLGQVYVRPGELVRAGQLLAELAEQDLQVERARWESQLAQHENAYIAAHTTANRAQLVINQSRAAEAEAQLQLVDAKIGRARLLAPFDGVVIQGDLSQQLGAPVTQGTELMTVAPSLRFRVIVEVDERDIGLLRVGQTGTLALSALPWDTHAIKVVRITPMATVVNGHNVYEVEAALGQATPDLRPGLQGSAHIVTGSAPMLANWSRRLRESLRRAAWEVTG